MNELLRQIAKFYYTDSNLGFTINFYPYLFAGAFTLGSVVLLGWILGVLDFDLSRVLNEDFGLGDGLTSYFDNYGTAFTSTGFSGDPIAMLQSQVTDLQAQVAFLQAGEQASYGNWGSTLDGDTSYYTTTSGTSSNHMNEALVFGGDKDSYNQIDHQPSYSDEDSYKINQPNYDSYQPVYDSYTSPLS